MTVRVPLELDINQRLWNDVRFLASYTIETQRECGGFLIRAVHGNIGVVGFQIGEDLEIVFKNNEFLHKGERFLGTAHFHPKTAYPSTGDCKSYLQDDYEEVMFVGGSKYELNLCVKIPGVTTQIKDDEEFDELEFEQEDMPEIADTFHFLFYHGTNNLKLMNPNLEQWPINISSLQETSTLETLLDTIKIKGTDNLPPEYGIKKTPFSDWDVSFINEINHDYGTTPFPQIVQWGGISLPKGWNSPR